MKIILLLLPFFVWTTLLSQTTSGGSKIVQELNINVKLYLYPQFELTILSREEIDSFLNQPIILEKLKSNCLSQYDFYLVPHQPLIKLEDRNQKTIIIKEMPLSTYFKKDNIIMSINAISENIYCINGPGCASDLLRFLRDTADQLCDNCTTKSPYKRYKCIELEGYDYPEMAKETIRQLKRRSFSTL